MLDPVTRLSLSKDWEQRVEAARLVARQDAAPSESMVLRLLRDATSAAVTAAIVAALLDARREAGIPLVLRSLGQDLPDEAEARDRFDQASQLMLEGLLNSELDGVDVRGAVIATLLETSDRHELVGALEAIGWIAPSGGFPASPLAVAHVEELFEHPDGTIRGLALKARAALASR